MSATATAQHVGPVRPRDRQRQALAIPIPAKGKHYKWAVDQTGHPQSWSRYMYEGWRLVPAKEAASLGLYGYVDKISGDEVVQDVNNAIRFGNVLLLDCTDEVWAEHIAYKADAFKELEDALEAEYTGQAEEAFEGSITHH